MCFIPLLYILQVTWEKFKIGNASNDAIGSFFRAKVSLKKKIQDSCKRKIRPVNGTSCSFLVVRFLS